MFTSCHYEFGCILKLLKNQGEIVNQCLVDVFQYKQTKICYAISKLLCFLALGTNIYFWISFLPAIVSLLTFLCLWNVSNVGVFVLSTKIYSFLYHLSQILSWLVDPRDWDEAPSHSCKAGCWNHGFESTDRIWSVQPEGWTVLVWKSSAFASVNTICILPGYNLKSLLGFRWNLFIQ